MRRIVLAIIILLSTVLPVAPHSYYSSKIEVSQEQDINKVFSQKHKKYIIRENINLRGKRIIIGEGSILIFKGGSLSNGTIVGNNTLVKAKDYEIFKRGYTRYRAYVAQGAKDSAPPSLLKEYHDCLVIEGTWSNKKCGKNWTGLLNRNDEDIMLAVKNYISLHASGRKIKMPTFNALGYESTKIPGNHDIDFNGSSINYPDDLSVWEDVSISLPNNTVACPLESGYGLISLGSNSIIKNLSIDGKSLHRQDEKVRLGVSCIISIGDSKNVILENIKISNVLGPGMTAQAGAKDLTFKDCYFHNIGEHILYSHQYLGYCHFENCTFDTWDSERISVVREGLNYLYKFDPPSDLSDESYKDYYHFELSFNNCIFINPHRVNSQGRSLGGFITGSSPIEVLVSYCKFIGEPPVLNPGGGSASTEKTKKAWRMIIRGCDGAPSVYPSKANYNIITEFYNCVNIPFRTVYAKRYENSNLYVDLYESNLENVSTSFKQEFEEPLVIKRCTLTDKGSGARISHPVSHRPVLFENCRFLSNHQYDYKPEVICLTNNNKKISFLSCTFDIPDYILIGGNKEIEELIVHNCTFHSVDSHVFHVKVNNNSFTDNKVSKGVDLGSYSKTLLR